MQPHRRLLTACGFPLSAGHLVDAAGFQGDFTDPATGDVNMGARWYTPSSGTFRNRDSYAGELRTPVSLNRFTYARVASPRVRPSQYCTWQRW